MTGAKEPGPRGEHDISRKPLRGECRAFSGASAVKLVCILQLQSAHEAAGALGTRHSLRPLIFRRQEIQGRTSRKTCGEIAKLWLLTNRHHPPTGPAFAASCMRGGVHARTGPRAISSAPGSHCAASARQAWKAAMFLTLGSECMIGDRSLG